MSGYVQRSMQNQNFHVAGSEMTEYISVPYKVLYDYQFILTLKIITQKPRSYFTVKETLTYL
jgi:hypothetical protein